MFNISATELLVIAIVALLILGPDKLPDAMRKLGRATRELRRITSGFEAELRDALSEPPEPPKAETPKPGPAAQAPMNPTAPVAATDTPPESLPAEIDDDAPTSTSSASTSPASTIPATEGSSPTGGTAG